MVIYLGGVHVGVVNLIDHGRVYEDDFNTPSLNRNWEVLPSDPSRYSLEGGKLRLFNRGEPLYMFYEPLTTIKRFVMDIKNTYNPTVEGEVGGVVVMADENNMIHIEEYLDTSLPTPTLRTYPWIRLIRNYDVYSAYWSEDGKEWYFLGSRSLGHDYPKIGLFIEGASDQDTAQSMDIEYIRINTSNEVTVANLYYNTKVELVDYEGNVLETRICSYGDTEVSFNLDRYDYPFQGNFVITLPDGNRFQPNLGEYKNQLKIYKGDLYYFELVVDLYYEEIDDSDPSNITTFEHYLFPNMERFLGYMKSGGEPHMYIKMIARNSFTDGTFRNVRIQLVPHGDEDDLKKVRLAPDVGGVPGAWSDNIMIIELPPNSDYIFWARLDRQEETENRYDSMFAFGFNVSSTYI